MIRPDKTNVVRIHSQDERCSNTTLFANIRKSKIKKLPISNTMTTSSTSNNFSCHMCCRTRLQVRLEPCGHDEICSVCFGRHYSKDRTRSNCPFCRNEVHYVKSATGLHDVVDFRSGYVADVRRHLRKTRQIKIFGQSFRANYLILDALMGHSDENFEDQVYQTHYSPNCSYNNYVCRIGEHTYSETRNAQTDETGFTSDLTVVVFSDLRGPTVREMSRMDRTAKRFSNAPTIWLLEQNRNISICFGPDKNSISGLQLPEGRDFRVENAFSRLITVSGDTTYTRDQMNELYMFLWAMVPKTSMEQAKNIFNRSE